MAVPTVAESTDSSSAASVPPEPPESPTAPRADHRALDRKLFHSLAWTGSSRLVMQAVTWASTIVVARLLSPSDYGLIGLATLYMGFVTMVSELGFGSAVVVLRGLADDEIAQLNTVSVLAGLVSSALSVALAVPLGRYFGAPNLPPVLMVLSTTFVITSIRSVPLALMQRDLEFRRISIRDSIAAAATAATAITLAVMGWRYWALAWSQVVGMVVLTAMTLRLRRHRFAWPQWRALGDVLRFSNRMIVGRLSWYVYSNADFFVAGRLLGQAALGGYTFAWTLTNLPTEKITALIGSITPAFFSAVQHDRAQLRRYFLVITEALALATFPACIGIGLTAAELVPAVFGKQWLAAVPVVQVLCLYTAIRTVRPVANNVSTVIGETRAMMWQGVGSAIAFPLAFWLASRWGAIGIASAWVLVYPIQFVLGLRLVFRNGVVSAGEYVRALWPAVSGTIVMAGAVLAVRATLPNTLPLMMRAGAEVSTGMVVYALTLLALHRERIVRIFQAVKAMRQRPAAAA